MLYPARKAHLWHPMTLCSLSLLLEWDCIGIGQPANPAIYNCSFLVGQFPRIVAPEV